MGEVHGFCDERFEPLETLFRSNQEQGIDEQVGAEHIQRLEERATGDLLLTLLLASGLLEEELDARADRLEQEIEPTANGVGGERAGQVIGEAQGDSAGDARLETAQRQGAFADLRARLSSKTNRNAPRSTVRSRTMISESNPRPS